MCASDSARTRAAASSMASGMPSRRRQISAMATALSPEGSKSGRTRRARSANNSMASSSSDNDGTLHVSSSPTPMGSRLSGQGWSAAGRHRAERRSTRPTIEEVLTIVEQQQHSSIVDESAKGVHRRAPRLIRYTQGARQRGGHLVRIGDRRQVDKSHTVGKFSNQLCCDLYREGRLADTACSGQREETIVADGTLQFSHLGSASDEPSELCWKVLRCNTVGDGVVECG